MASILIIEDDVDIAFLFERFLTIGGHKVVGKAFNGITGIELFKNLKKKPDIVLMDHRMPIKNGLEATQEILTIDPNSKIIFLSADLSVKEIAIQKGVKLFLEKPFDFEELFQAINSVI
jgi:two-component system chemotaxis response regulator CheY